MPSNLKVLHVVNSSFVLPYFIGDQFEHFGKRGIAIYVACFPSEHFILYSRKKGFIPVAVNILRKFSVRQDIKAIVKLVRLIKHEKIDVVIGHTPKASLLAMIAAFIAKVDKRIYFRHGIMYETSTGLKRKILKQIECFTGYLATKVVCVSKSVVDLSNSNGLSNPKKHVLLGYGSCNGIDALTKFNPDLINYELTKELKAKHDIIPGDRIVGYVGRLVNDKGISELIQAWMTLLNEHSNIKLLLVGPLESRDGLSKKMMEMIVNTPTILYTGLIEDVVPYYSLMDIFILPSYREGLPTVVLEASSMGVPVITTHSTGCVDAIRENQTGIFTEINPTDIAAKIDYYLKNPYLAKRHGSAGRAFVLKNFHPADIWREIEEKVLEIRLS
jgi:glycosyltransferase involved in cell wall biosynthesis